MSTSKAYLHSLLVYLFDSHQEGNFTNQRNLRRRSLSPSRPMPSQRFVCLLCSHPIYRSFESNWAWFFAQYLISGNMGDYINASFWNIQNFGHLNWVLSTLHALFEDVEILNMMIDMCSGSMWIVQRQVAEHQDANYMHLDAKNCLIHVFYTFYRYYLVIYK